MSLHDAHLYLYVWKSHVIGAWNPSLRHLFFIAMDLNNSRGDGSATTDGSRMSLYFVPWLIAGWFGRAGRPAGFEKEKKKKEELDTFLNMIIKKTKQPSDKVCQKKFWETPQKCAKRCGGGGGWSESDYVTAVYLFIKVHFIPSAGCSAELLANVACSDVSEEQLWSRWRRDEEKEEFGLQPRGHYFSDEKEGFDNPPYRRKIDNALY